MNGNASDKDNKNGGVKRNKPNIFSKLFICWICPVLVKGNKRNIEEEDLIVPKKKFDAARLGDKLERYWLEEYENAQRKNRMPSMWKVLFRAYWLAYMPGAFLLLINASTRTAQPFLFSRLLTYWSVEATITKQEAGYYALGMLLLNFIGLMAQHHNNLFVQSFSLRVKVATSSLLYRKVLRMSQISLGDIAAGKLVNLLSNDVARFDYVFMFLHNVWMVPLQLGVVLYFLYEAANFAPYVGLFGVLLLIFPVQAALTKLSAVLRRSTAKRTDKRIKLMSEIISGIQVIKMYAWEKPFQLVVRATRGFEVGAIKRALFVRSMFIGFMLFTDRSTLFLTSLTIVLTGSMLTATLIYPIQQYLSIVQMNLSFILPIVIASVSEMNVSLDRMRTVLMMEERHDDAITAPSQGVKNMVSFNGMKSSPDQDLIVARKYSPTDGNADGALLAAPRPAPGGEYSIELSDMSASWTNSQDPSEMSLKNISMRIRKGKLCAVIGPVGSGKSSLLQVLLRELPVSKGTVNVRGSLSYACQESWLFPATVRENILFGLPYNVAKYKEVCEVCSLLPDFKQFPYGDLSLVGERGVSLSGGQRARINLARAIYRDADIYLLDDPLSAVDANVGRQLFERCISGYLRGRTCVLVTHQIHFIKSADTIVVLNEGVIENMGPYEELVKSGKEFSLLLSSLSEGADGDEGEKTEKPAMLRGISKISVRSEEAPEEQVEQEQAAEQRSEGRVKWAVFGRYVAAVRSWLVVAFAVLTLLLTQAGATLADYWLSFWTNQVNAYIQNLPEGEEPDPGLGTQVGILTTGGYLYVYGFTVLYIIIMTHVRIWAFVTMTMRASVTLHNTVFEKLTATVMRFFDTNPSGRVLNRFSKDMGAMDELLPRSILETLQMYLSAISILVLNALALPFTLIPTAVLMIIFIFLLKWYLNAAQAVKRLEGTTKSPVFNMINSTISGLSTIRSANAQNRLLHQFDEAQDLNTSAFFTFLGGSSAFGLYLDMICLMYLACIIMIFLFIDFGELIPVGSVGLAVSQSMVLTMLLQMAARMTGDLLGQMTSVERVLEYTALPPEEHMHDGPTKPPPTWPEEGHVKFEGVNMKYAEEDPPVLKNLNFTIESGWKVGVVGRTGAGKSSLISALFRLSNIDGSIKIDDIDTRGIAKTQLRSKISIIPQEPVLFSATLRYNLDPFNYYSDDDIWRALEQVELKESITALDMKVSEGGGNFSVGQRQLVCLARAVLRSNTILVMDEATANVDPQTDALIQKTIRKQFAKCTVITIAHRLNTIMDSDRVLVMDKGEAVEFDYPYLLLKNPDSVLSFMVRETGDKMAKVLFEMAKWKYLSEHSEK
ncbi:ATP-binding cassette sub-family C member 4-like [Epargyreus clarus]|uniref:ATP-binding cassette sub-family C member 4-like n=1 Tax=Epargyreus clarus TaxID=520877 RepID=UPI003C2BA084